ncbi:50S ribosomal protein L16 [Candidatus Woesearchaeota archaeon]|nr:50S ribosomal protein L16 [Candidatus Woesearchaeota archaeon]
MAKLRKGRAYRRLERPYTRRSRYRQKDYVGASPVSKVVRYHMGNVIKQFEVALYLVSKEAIQIRHNAIESARQTGNRELEAVLGKNGYRMLIRMYPHHILRENPLASGAGADRMSTGMARSFGKPIGIAAQVKVGKILIEVNVDKAQEQTGRIALERASKKLPCACRIERLDTKPAK